MLSTRARLLPLLLAAAIAGCGGDDEPSASTTRELPDLPVPVSREPPATTPAQPPAPEPAPAPVDPATETLPKEVPSPAPPPAEPPQDTPENDSPPPPGSPAERFEEWCDANPGACG